MRNLNEIEIIMNSGKAQLKKSIDLSVEYLKKDPNLKTQINKTWEDFLSEFVEYVRQKEKETGEELIKGIPIIKLIKLLK